VDFGVLNDNLIKGLISCVKCISRFLMKVQMYSLIHHLKYNHEGNGTVNNMHTQPMNSSILKNLCQAKQGILMNKNKLNINLVQHLWLDLDQERIDQMLPLSIGYPWKQLDHKKKFFKKESMEDMK
jgi:hypothetical protein